MHGDQLLLLTDGAEEAESVAAEADQSEHAERAEAERRGNGHPDALVASARAEHEEWQHEPGGHLDTDAGDERRRTRAQARAGAGAEGECRSQSQKDQRVVVRSADGEHEQDRVQADERHGRAPRATEPAGGAAD